MTGKFRNYMVPISRSFQMLLVFLLITPVMKVNSATFQDEEKARVRMDLNYFKVSDDSSYMTVKVQTRVDRKYVPVSGVIINLFLNHQTKSGMMGNITTDELGQGKFVFPDKFYPAKDTLSTLRFMARLKEDPNYQDRITTLEIRDAFIDITPQDSSRQLTVQITENDSLGTKIPVEGANIKCYVERMFSLLPIGEEYNFTDENGMVTIDFPEDLPGDSAGNIQLLAGVEEDDNYGNVLISQTLPWGSDALIQEDTYDHRNMWSSRDKTPIFLLVFPNLILLTVWGVIVYLIVQLIKIYRNTEIKM